MGEINRNEIHQYLTFKIAAETYAINVASIKEVLGVPRITKVPRMPDFMSGVINLRGSVVPVLDLRSKFGLGETPMTVDTSIIVTELRDVFEGSEEEELTIGIFSDSVEKVITIEPENIEPPPKIGIAIDTAFIKGMGRVDDDFVIILNINRVLTEREIQLIQAGEAVANEQ
ncbi:MAG TPA: chemotaxis protein CheW [Treponemataceae bacterium]|jgi:purine-binding chemotaxis protein CheW|nr:chemotaxis protein CheW [Treponemataceae bacterium]